MSVDKPYTFQNLIDSIEEYKYQQCKVDRIRQDINVEKAKIFSLEKDEADAVLALERCKATVHRILSNLEK